jgi:hypothetical protein
VYVCMYVCMYTLSVLRHTCISCLSLSMIWRSHVLPTYTPPPPPYYTTSLPSIPPTSVITGAFFFVRSLLQFVNNEAPFAGDTNGWILTVFFFVDAWLLVRVQHRALAQILPPSPLFLQPTLVSDAAHPCVCRVLRCSGWATAA